MRTRLHVAAPLGAAVALLALFVILLVRQAGKYDGTAEPEEHGAASPPAVSPPAPRLEVPSGQPTAEDPFGPRERTRYGGEYVRWNLGELPEGWDEAVARRIHDLTEAFDIEIPRRRGPEGLKAVEARKRLIEYLASLGPEALPTLGAILDVEPYFVARRLIFQAIGKLGPRSELATWILRDYYDARHGDPANISEVKRVIEAMGFLKNETSFEVLGWYARNGEPSHRRFRDRFIMALGEHPRREEAIDIFADGMHDPSFQTRNKSAQALGKVRHPGTLGELYDAYDNERIWYAKQTILGTIGKIGRPEAIPFLEEQALAARESGVRLSAANAIRRIVEQTGSREGRRALEGLARTEPDDTVRSHIRKWFEKL